MRLPPRCASLPPSCLPSGSLVPSCWLSSDPLLPFKNVADMCIIAASTFLAASVATWSPPKSRKCSKNYQNPAKPTKNCTIPLTTQNTPTKPTQTRTKTPGMSLARVHLVYILDSHMAPYGAYEVVQSTGRSSVVPPNKR